MIRSAARLVAIVAVLALAGCVSSPPVPVETRPPVVEEPRAEPPQEPDRTPPRTPGTIRPDQQTQEREQVPSAAAGLIAQGWRQHNANNHEVALSIAERAQRIEPRNPEVYLLMASAQFDLYRLDSAEQLARRGLSLSRSGTRVNGQLQRLLKRVVAAQ